MRRVTCRDADDVMPRHALLSLAALQVSIPSNEVVALLQGWGNLFGNTVRSSEPHRSLLPPSGTGAASSPLCAGKLIDFLVACACLHFLSSIHPLRRLPQISQLSTAYANLVNGISYTAQASFTVNPQFQLVLGRERPAVPQ